MLQNARERSVFLNRLKNCSSPDLVYSSHLLSDPSVANADVIFIPVFLAIVEGHRVLWSVLLSVLLQGLGFPRDKSASRSLLLGSCKNITFVQSRSCHKPPDWSLETMPKRLPSSFRPPQWTFVHSFIQSIIQQTTRCWVPLCC